MSGFGVSTLELRSIRIAVASDSAKQRDYLQQALARSGLKIVLNEPLTELFLARLEEKEVDVLLLDLDETCDQDDVVLDRLLEQTGAPIIFNDVTALTVNEPRVLAKWYGKLLRKIVKATGSAEDVEAHSAAVAAALTGVVHMPRDADAPQGDIAQNVWALGASLGGPEAVKRFLNALPRRLPAAFVLAQHLGANFVNLLAEQLARSTPFDVLVPVAGHVLRHGQVLVAPTDARIVINPIGAVELHALRTESSYTPCIDTVIEDIAGRYPGRSGAIIFSGMCDDGVRGCHTMVEQGGEVWAQSTASCVISSMPDRVRASGNAQHSGTPEELARKLIAFLSSPMTKW
ncbi:MAG: chemotaxis protein CheB [Pseudomonadota bacterium]|nr:MAG: chemotaxis protein CheB [Pseudomonadota bacterium]